MNRRKYRATAITLATMTLLCLAVGTSIAPSAAPLARAEQPGASLLTCAGGAQFLGFSEALDKTSFGGFAVSELSGISYDPATGLYYAVADRAGTVQSHVFELSIPIGTESIGTPAIQAVTVLRPFAGGAAYTGATLDGEGIVVRRDGGWWIASESGTGANEQPEVRAFSSEGIEIGSLAVPPRFLRGPSNLGFESLTLTPDGRDLFTVVEKALPTVGTAAADGETADFRDRLRILRYEDRGPDGFEPTAQYYYLSEPDAGDTGVTELLALSPSDLLVMERRFVAGVGNRIELFRVSLRGAEDVSAESTLATTLAQPLTKELVLDLSTCPDTGASIPPGATQPNALLDNFEAMTLGPRLEGGRTALVLVSDDNGGSNQRTRLVVLAIPTRDLVGNDADKD